MESEAKRPCRLAFAAIIAAVLAVAALTGTLMGCAPSAPASDAGGSGTAAAPAEQEAGGDDAMAGQPVNWTMESDCVTCHTAEAASATDSACPQGVAHEAEGVTCVTCHTDEAVLAEVHDGIAMSDKKNIITPFRHHSFTFLKMRVTLTETGKVVMKLSRKSIRAMRRKMDIFRRWMDEGRMGPEDVFQSYQSWRAHAKRCNSYDTLRAMDERFTRMFAEELAGRRKPFPCTMKATRTGCGWIYRRHGAVIEEEMCA